VVVSAFGAMALKLVFEAPREEDGAMAATTTAGLRTHLRPVLRLARRILCGAFLTFASATGTSAFASDEIRQTDGPFPERQAYGRLEIEFLAVPTSQLDQFQQTFDGPAVKDLADLLNKTAAKVVSSASIGLRTGVGTMTVQIEDGSLMFEPRLVAPHQLFLDGKFGGKLLCTFSCPIQPESYQLLFFVDQPSSTVKASFNAIVVRMPKIHWLEPANESGENPDSHDANPPADFPPMPDGSQALYQDRGDNVDGFETKFDHPDLIVQNGTIVGQNGGGWESLPVSFTGNVQIDYDVYTDSKDAGAFLILYGHSGKRGVNIVNCPEQTFNGHNIIECISDLLNHQRFYYSFKTLATAASTDFPNRKWVHVTITKKGDQLVDNVAGQTVTADISTARLPRRVHVGLGYYSTSNLGGPGLLKYANFRIVQLPDGPSRASGRH
jgi:hypothetical protein